MWVASIYVVACVPNPKGCSDPNNWLGLCFCFPEFIILRFETMLEMFSFYFWAVSISQTICATVTYYIGIFSLFACIRPHDHSGASGTFWNRSSLDGWSISSWTAPPLVLWSTIFFTLYSGARVSTSALLLMLFFVGWFDRMIVLLHFRPRSPFDICLIF